MSQRLSIPPESWLVSPAIPKSPGLELPWRERRDWFRARLEHNPPPRLSAEEIEAHFSAVPPHYWERVDESGLTWGLETIHGFLELVASPNVPPTTPFVNWRQAEDSQSTRVLLCTWDRHGLLAKAAAAFSAVRMNILQANIFTRSDNIVLDEFVITNVGGRGPINEARLQEMTFLLEGALSEPPRFVSVWACSRHKFLAPLSKVAPRITFDNDSSPNSTLLSVEAEDRLGLLYDILQAIADAGLNLMHARVETESEVARDTLHVSDELGQKLLDARRLELVRTALEAALILNDAEDETRISRIDTKKQ